MKARVHHHPCAHCGAKTVCDGELEPNYDGWPAVICLVFHPAPHVFCCEACVEQRSHDTDRDADDA